MTGSASLLHLHPTIISEMRRFPDGTQNRTPLKVGQSMGHCSITSREMVLLSRQASAQASWMCPTIWVDTPPPNGNSWHAILREIRGHLSKVIPQTVAVRLSTCPIVPIWDRPVHNLIRDLNAPRWSIISYLHLTLATNIGTNSSAKILKLWKRKLSMELKNLTTEGRLL